MRILMAIVSLALFLQPAWAGDEQKTLSQWIEQLQSPEDADARRIAAYELGRLGPQAAPAVDALIAALDDNVQEVRWYAADALGRIGPAAIKAAGPLASAVKAKKSTAGKQESVNDTLFFRCAISTLGRLGPGVVQQPEAYELAVLAMEKSNDLPLKVAGAEAMWLISQHEQALPTLLRILSGEQGQGSYEACQALVRLDLKTNEVIQALAGALASSDPDTSRAAASRLGKLGKPALPEIVGQLQSNNSTTLSALAALAIAADQAREVFHAQDTNEEEFTEYAAAWRAVLPSLLELLSSADAAIQGEAALVLARLGPFAADVLAGALLDSQRQAAAAEALLKMEAYLPEDIEEIPQLNATLEKPASLLHQAMGEPASQLAAVRAFAMLELGRYRPQAAPLLRSLLTEENVLLRRYAIRGLKQIQEAGQKD